MSWIITTQRGNHMIDVLIVIVMLVAAYTLGYTRGYKAGVQSGSWESVLARATKVNERYFGKKNQL